MGREGRRQRRRAGGRAAYWRLAAALAVGAAYQAVFLVADRTVLAEHWARRAQQAIVSRQLPVAGALAKRSLDLNPHQGYAAFFAGVAEREAGRTTQAAKVFRQALRTMAHRSRPLRDLAACEEKMGERAAAADHLAEALAIEPLPLGDAASSRAMLGQILFYQERWAEGTVWFRSVVAGAPQARFQFDGLALGYERFGALDVAVASACALLRSESPRLISRAYEHLLRLSQSPAQRPTILAVVQEMEPKLRPNDPRRDAIERILKNLAVER